MAQLDLLVRGALLRTLPSPKVAYFFVVTICSVERRNEEDYTMAWSKPKAREIKCGMEINMYGPGEDDERDVGREVI